MTICTYSSLFISINNNKKTGQYNTTADISTLSQGIATVYPKYGKQGLCPVAYTSNQKIEVSDE